MTSIYTRSDSKVEVIGFEARHYDFFMNLITGGSYPFFIRQVVKDMQIQPDEVILDFGCGTGRNISLMNKYLSAEGRALGLDIGSEMLEQAQRRFANHPTSPSKTDALRNHYPIKMSSQRSLSLLCCTA
jgi:ubiquinone/menaquinone biosynthesis C-methylase UbiE